MSNYAVAKAPVLPVVQTALTPELRDGKMVWEKAQGWSPSYPFVVGQRLGKDTCGGVDVRVFEDAHSSHELAHCAVHSPTGLNWGYGGSGPADLALSLLCWAALVPAEKEGRNAPISARDYQEFKFEFVGSMPSCWLMSQEQIRHWIRGRGGIGVRRVLDAQYVSDGMCGCNGEWVKDGKCTACQALAERPEIPAEVVGLWKERE